MDSEPPRHDDEEEAVALPAATMHTVRISRSRDRGRALLPPLELRVVAGPDLGLAYRANGDRIVIGIHPKADVVLQDKTVSRFHCEIVVEGERVVIRDLGSRNGTVVNGVGIVHAYLHPGCHVSVGCTELEFGIGSDSVEVELSNENRFGSLVGESVAMRAAFALLKRAAATSATVLLSGETGTGKEVAAESIHQAGDRANGPFVIVDCAAIPAELMESELFGHEKGAFTGAVSAKQGAFEAANGGSIFLDEIGELATELQPKLLRALERRHVKRVGSTRYVPVDVRVIAATNRNLQTEVNSGRFRSDLYYRLAVLDVRMPALRERPEDLPMLVEHILASLGATQRPEANVLRTEACRIELARHPWPGNVRELRNYVERCLALADWRVLTVAPSDSMPPPAGASASSPGSSPSSLRSARETWMRDFERKYLEGLLASHGGNVSAAARAAGIDRKYLYRLLWRNGLR